MCEETVFWDLNYAMQYRALGTGDIMVKVLKVGYNSDYSDLMGQISFKSKLYLS